jgi:predicted O-linked N-acetylglucosamine transferase (SPINDLY family)
MDWKLIAAATVFGLYIIYRFRPIFSGGRTGLAALAEARKRIDAAKTDEERALALAAAGDACAATVGRTTGAVGYYTRAMRANPASVEIVERAAAGLSRRPRALEQLMWRRLATESWEGDNKPAALAALTQLQRVLDRSPRSRTRARVFENVLVTLGAPPAPRRSLPPARPEPGDAKPTDASSTTEDE